MKRYNLDISYDDNQRSIEEKSDGKYIKYVDFIKYQNLITSVIFIE